MGRRGRRWLSVLSPSSIGAWAGSSPCKPGDLKLGLSHLAARGHRVVVPEATKRFATRRESAARPFLAGADAAKVRAFLELWRDDSVGHIIGTRGGYGCLRLLPLLDRVSLAKSKRKIFWGFSDYTVIQHYLHARTGFPWVHSPHANSEALRAPTPLEARAWRRLETDELSHHPMKALHLPRGARAPASALLIGGNLTSLASLVGTPWQPRPRTDFYLFLEDLNEAPYRIDRMLQQLTASGLLVRCRAVLLGHFTDCGRWQGVARAWAKERGLPLFAGLKVGHERPNLPLTLGLRAEIVKISAVRSELRVPNLPLGC